MLVLTHVLIAFASLAYTAYLFYNPSKRGVHISYGFVAATLGSGTLLIATTKGHMLEACMMGFFYLGLVTFGIVSVQRKLATEEHRS
jgi:hypothetical protein